MKVASSTTLARLLRSRLMEGGDPCRAITLVSLIERNLPYAHVRSEAGLAGKAEYDLALLAFLARRDLVQVDPVVVEAVERELELPEPGLGFVAGLEDRLLRLREGSPAAPSEVNEPRFSFLEPEPDDAGTVESSAEELPLEEARTDEPRPEAETHQEPSPDPAASPPVELESWAPADAAAPTCWKCRARLPDRRRVRFCPRCGVSAEERRCSGCGDPVEDDWRFCVGCGAELVGE